MVAQRTFGASKREPYTVGKWICCVRTIARFGTNMKARRLEIMECGTAAQIFLDDLCRIKFEAIPKTCRPAHHRAVLFWPAWAL